MYQLNFINTKKTALIELLLRLKHQNEYKQALLHKNLVGNKSKQLMLGFEFT